MKLNNMSKMRKMSLGIMISFPLIFTSSMIFINTSCSKKIDHTLDPSDSDWKKHFYSEDHGVFAPESTTGFSSEDTNGDFVGGWQNWIKTTDYDTLDLGAFSVVADNAFYSNSNGRALLIGDMKIKHLIFSNSTCASIGKGAFAGCSSLTSVNLSDSLTSIGLGAFRDCSSLTSVNLPDTLESIGESAFRDCASITSITLPNSLTSIGNYVFQLCSSLVSLTLPNFLTSIGNGAFDLCISLTSIDLPDTLETIGNSAFSGCSSLTSVILPNSLTSIGEGAFESCSSINSIVASYDEVPEWEGEAIFFNVAETGTVKNTGALSSDDFLTYLQGYGIPNDDSWTVAP